MAKENIEYSNSKRRTRAIKKLSGWVGILVLVAMTMGSIVSFGGPSASQQQSPTQTANISEIISAGWTSGNPDATTTLVEYSDFQCPACAFFYRITKELVKGYGDKVKFVYRYFPLREIHKNADIAARAAEAAGKQGKFWEMHDILFENQTAWAEKQDPMPIFTGYVEKLGLDVAQFKTDIDSKEVKDKVESDFQSGIAAGVDATPTFFANGTKVPPPSSYDEFKQYLDNVVLQSK